MTEIKWDFNTFDRNLLSAVYELVATDDEPFLSVITQHKGVSAPPHLRKAFQTVFRITAVAAPDLVFGAEGISFSARFSGKHWDMFVPYEAVLSLVGRNSGVGYSRGFVPVEGEDVGDENIKVIHLSRCWMPKGQADMRFDYNVEAGTVSYPSDAQKVAVNQENKPAASVPSLVPVPATATENVLQFRPRPRPLAATKSE